MQQLCAKLRRQTVNVKHLTFMTAKRETLLTAAFNKTAFIINYAEKNINYKISNIHHEERVNSTVRVLL